MTPPAKGETTQRGNFPRWRGGGGKTDWGGKSGTHEKGCILYYKLRKKSAGEERPFREVRDFKRGGASDLNFLIHAKGKDRIVGEGGGTCFRKKKDQDA